MNAIRYFRGLVPLLMLLIIVWTPVEAQQPVIRTAEDIAAIRQLEAEVMARQRVDPREETPSHFEVPLTIKVGLTPYAHCSDWVQAGMPIDEVVEMDFKEYIQNVLPNEWINTWHPQSLMSGAVAAKSFAWWRITLDNPRPMGADVVDNTCDQVYFENSERPTTNAAIDATWHFRMSRNNRIIEIHYLAHDWQCEDLGWEMCMGQWGTQEKAEAGWFWQDILHFYYDPIDINVTNTIPPNVDLILNGGFDQDAERWLTWGGIEGEGVVDGVYRFHRKAESNNPAVVYQDLNYRVPQDTPLRVSLMLGNSSAVEKTVEVHLRQANSWTGAISCSFTLPPGLPMQKYTVYGDNPNGWVGVRLEIQGHTADGLPSYLMDKVKVMFRTKGKPADVPACDAPRPGKPTIVSPVAGSTYGKQVPVSLIEGESNLRPGYSPAYQVQVSESSDFASTVYDNEEDLSTSPQFSITLNSGAYYVRARQFDGIDRFSRWTKGVPMMVIVMPGTPLLLAPAGEVSSDGLIFSWSEAEDTDSYKVVLRDSLNNTLGKAAVTPSSCSGGICTLPASAFPVSFTVGQSYQWRVIAKNENGKSKSGWQPFTVIVATATPQPTDTPAALPTDTPQGETPTVEATPEAPTSTPESPTATPTTETIPLP
jgi:hypothetical protein